MEDRNTLLMEGAKGLRALAELLESAIVEKKQEEHTSPEAPAPTLTLIDVRKVLAEKSREGHTEQVRTLLEKYGADKLSAINPANYQSLVCDAECLGATIDDIKSAIEEKSDAGFSEWLPDIFKHHVASNLEDLSPDNYPGFLRDIRSLGHE